MMPHLERANYPFNWGYYPKNQKNNKISPWVYAFHNAYNWLKLKFLLFIMHA